MIIGITALAIALLFVLVQRAPHGMFHLAARFLGLVGAPAGQGEDGDKKREEVVRVKITEGPRIQVEKEEEITKIKVGNGIPAPPVILQQQEEDEEDDDEAPAFPALNSAQRASGGLGIPSPPVIIQPQDEEDDDEAPAFPSLNSAQRASGGMGPPPIPILRQRQPPASSPASSLGSDGSTPRQGGFMPPPPKLSGMMPPPSIIPSRSPPGRQLQPPRISGGLMPPSTGASGVAAGSGLHLPNKPKSSSTSSRRKVILTPGHSPLDWARLQSSNTDLRTGVPSNAPLLKITPSELAKHKSKDDAWTVIEDRVYSVSRYLAFHPGGEKELLRVAGRDGTKLYMKTHPWVNYENMLRGCLVGVFVPEVKVEKGLEDMD